MAVRPQTPFYQRLLGEFGDSPRILGEFLGQSLNSPYQETWVNRLLRQPLEPAALPNSSPPFPQKDFCGILSCASIPRMGSFCLCEAIYAD